MSILCHRHLDIWMMIYLTEIKTPPQNFLITSKIWICGDFNACAGTLYDIVGKTPNGTDKGLNELIPHQFLEDVYMDITRRHSVDKTSINHHGKQLIELCKSIGWWYLMGESGLIKEMENIRGWIQPVVVLWTTWLGRHYYWIASWILPSYLNSQSPIIELLHVFWVVLFSLTNETLTREITGYHMTNMNGLHPTWMISEKCYVIIKSSSYRSCMINAPVWHVDINEVARSFW